MQFAGKIVLITGGTGALGHVVAERFIAEGASVATSYLFEDEVKRLPDSFRSRTTILRADVTDDEDVVALFQQVITRHGKVDILINLVGGFVPKSDVRDVSLKDWEHMVGINLRSVFLCSREFLRRAGKSPYGRIISMAAMTALRPAAGRAPYAVSKAGVVTLTEVLGEELKGSGITANAIAPSILRTGANMKSAPAAEVEKWVAPEEIAEIMIMLCSERGRSVNGVCIPVFGGV